MAEVIDSGRSPRALRGRTGRATGEVIEQVARHCARASRADVEAHLRRLGPDYLGRFDPREIAAHADALVSLDGTSPLWLRYRVLPEERLELVLCTWDRPFLFASLCGVLGSFGLSIEGGAAFTHRPARGDKGHRLAAVDLFVCRLPRARPLDVLLGALERRLAQVVELLQGDRQAVERARQLVNEAVAGTLAAMGAPLERLLYPVHLEVEPSHDGPTRLVVRGQDTPFFLYALSAALSLAGASVQSVTIRTEEGEVHDELYLLDQRQRPLVQPEQLDHLRLAVLLVKQFTYFLPGAPDPHAALRRFDQLVDRIARLPRRRDWVDRLLEPRLLSELARLCGTSTFVWENFLRQQHDALLPLLDRHLRGQPLATPPELLGERLRGALQICTSTEAAIEALNAFKDRELFLIDLDHIAAGHGGLRRFSHHLTVLAEVVVREAARLVYDDLVGRYGPPQALAGVETPYALFGLGKLGGGELGYASDLELLVVYSDRGQTAGPRVIGNQEFFNRFAMGLRRALRAREEGIFEVDLRLRPHGRDGPLAVRLAEFTTYYGPGGQAHALELLALVRLRAIAGDLDFGRQVERLRDSLLYGAAHIDPGDLWSVLRRQARAATPPGRINVKYAPGGLAELEICVQLLQVRAGREMEAARTTDLYRALEVLDHAGLFREGEGAGLLEAYRFFRRLINGLRVLHGRARDLLLPEDPLAYRHLARRMGHISRDGDPAARLRADWAMHRARVRALSERVLRPLEERSPQTYSIVDLLVQDDVSAADRRRVLSRLGLADPERAWDHLRAMAQPHRGGRSFVRLAILAADALSRLPDPDMALANWRRLAEVLDDPPAHFDHLLAHPRQLTLLLSILAASRFLAEQLVRHPDDLDWATLPENVQHVKPRHELTEDLETRSEAIGDEEAWLDELASYRRRELFRIAVRDVCLGKPFEEIVADLSRLAGAIIDVHWRRCLARQLDRAGLDPGPVRFAILAFGKLGAAELNYSSDVDLLALFDPSPPPGVGATTWREVLARAFRHTIAGLSGRNGRPPIYRVDMRLRPHGHAGELITTADSLLVYYRDQAAPWEIQALLKLRPIAGDTRLGRHVVDQLGDLLRRPPNPAVVIAQIEHMRRLGMSESAARHGTAPDLKDGPGGIRDIEFFVQALQLAFGATSPELLVPSTLEALRALETSGHLDPTTSRQLRDDYVFLRRLEHLLQIHGDQQAHALPRDPVQQNRLARHMLGPQASRRDLQLRLDAIRHRVLTRRRQLPDLIHHSSPPTPHSETPHDDHR